ncbi:MAG: class I tRNA ligase family protein, partial [Chloroflexi bacterium]|nr:class I tRNA ligase family protein [Chloroflexota bacterium]
MSDDTASPGKPKSAFEPLPDELDFPSMERRMLDLWAAEDTFERLRAKNAEGPRWSFFDGPITANNPMGVHHAWGRTYKDVYQRYRAMRGYHQRYQNGFDCQGLWLEVEVEKDLGFNSKRDIEEFGLEAFADACRERVEKFSGVQTDQSVRLGQWMDWDDSYFTHSDNNIEHIWHFLRRCNERGWIAAAQRAMPWCARCGTALSQHELIDTYAEVEHDAVYVRLPIHERPNTWLLIWTTTPWTLAANVAAAVHPDLTYVEVAADDGRYLLAEAVVSAVFGEGAEVVARHQGSDLLDLTYDGPFDDLPAVEGVTHRVIPWTDVGADEGTGIVHIAPGAGEEDFLLGRDLGLEVLVPIDENGNYTDGYDWLTGRDAREVADDVVAHLRTHGLLYRHHTYTHRYPHCWRCQEELVFRVDDEWFIRADEVRQPMLDA